MVLVQMFVDHYIHPGDVVVLLQRMAKALSKERSMATPILRRAPAVGVWIAVEWRRSGSGGGGEIDKGKHGDGF
ncbi:unnamed protein product [Microthlaspi erraticum]|uniref:Uncharacterized protein n=1 Tax=Microthlaspi erraticum TaxID=1685480 RepID=A0A6D2I675_9BRAS|nr:unnamed protein product [Microthlaspi erraticum]